MRSIFSKYRRQSLLTKVLTTSIVLTLVKSARLVVNAGALALLAAVKPVWVHGGDDGDVRGVHQLRDSVLTVKKVLVTKASKAFLNSHAVSLEQRLGEVIEHLPAHGLVTVHVGHVAHHGLQQLPRAWNGERSLADLILIMSSDWSLYTRVHASGDPDPGDVLTED